MSPEHEKQEQEAEWIDRPAAEVYDDGFFDLGLELPESNVNVRSASVTLPGYTIVMHIKSMLERDLNLVAAEYGRIIGKKLAILNASVHFAAEIGQ